MCDVLAPTSVVITESGTVLVVSWIGATISKVVKKGMQFQSLFHFNFFLHIYYMFYLFMVVYLFICVFFIFFYLVFMLGNGEYRSVVVVDSAETTECFFDRPWGITVDEKTHSCFISEWRTSRILKITFFD
jgi:hypothetical protein